MGFSGAYHQGAPLKSPRGSQPIRTIVGEIRPFSAVAIAPCFNLGSSPQGVRVPSGKTMRDAPVRSSSIERSTSA